MNLKYSILYTALFFSKTNSGSCGIVEFIVSQIIRIICFDIYITNNILNFDAVSLYTLKILTYLK